MAATASLSVSLGLVATGINFNVSSSWSPAQAGTKNLACVQTIGNGADEIIVFPADLVTEGVTRYAIKNLDPTNNVTLKITTASKLAFQLIGPGECYPGRTTKTAGQDPEIWAIASVAPCDIQVLAVGT